MWRLGPCKVCTVLEFLWVPTGRRAKIQSGGSNSFSVPHLVRKLPRGHLRKTWKTTEFYNGFGYRQSFTGWVSVHYRHHKHPACIRSLWGLCWTGVYWIMVTFLEGCNSKLHFYFFMKWNWFSYPHQIIHLSVDTYYISCHTLAWGCADGGQLQIR